MSIGAPLGVDVTSTTSQGEQGLERINQKLKTTEQGCRKATLAARDLNQEMGKQLRQGAQAARGTGLSGGISQVGAGVAAGGAMGLIGTIAGIGATMYQVVKRFTDLAEESAKRRLGFEEDITQAAEKAKDARGASAEKGLTQEQAYRQALYAGGPKAIERADAMIKAGVDPATAYEASANTQDAADIHGSKQVSELMALIARRGGNVAEAAKKLKARPWLLESAKDTDTQAVTRTNAYADFKEQQAAKNPALKGEAEDARDAANQMARAHQASLANLASDLMGERPDDRRAQGDYNIEVDPFLKRAEDARKTKGETALADRNNTAAGYANAGRQRELNLARNPEGTLKSEAIDAINKGFAKMERAAELQSRLAASLDQIFSPGGSLETQLIRAMRDRDRALAGDR